MVTPARRASCRSGLPWMADQPLEPQKTLPSSKVFERIVFFGRLETRKGLDIFVEALLNLKGHPNLKTLKEIVLLGPAGSHIYEDTPTLTDLLKERLNIPVRALTDFNTRQAQEYLRQHAADTLVVIPSRSETFGFTLIEVSFIEGLNFIFSNASGMAEVLKEAGTSQEFAPTVPALTEKISQCLAEGPRPPP